MKLNWILLFLREKMRRQRDQKQGGKWAGNDIQQLLGKMGLELFHGTRIRPGSSQSFQGRILRNKNG